MNKINYEISQLNFELIRDKIGQILANELPYQPITENIIVWQERFVPFSKNELPAITVTYNNSSYDMYDQFTRRGNNTYYIDIHMDSPHTQNSKGDTKASLDCQRIAGIVSYILASNEYLMLDFDPGLVETKQIESIEMGRLTEQNTSHVIVARVTFNVRARESVQGIDPLTVEKVTTQIKLNETDEGHYFISETT